MTKLVKLPTDKIIHEVVKNGEIVKHYSKSLRQNKYHTVGP